MDNSHSVKDGKEGGMRLEEGSGDIRFKEGTDKNEKKQISTSSIFSYLMSRGYTTWVYVTISCPRSTSR